MTKSTCQVYNCDQEASVPMLSLTHGDIWGVYCEAHAESNDPHVSLLKARPNLSIDKPNDNRV